jgi:hypothetical protein
MMQGSRIERNRAANILVPVSIYGAPSLSLASVYRDSKRFATLYRALETEAVFLVKDETPEGFWCGRK